jgi:hypothetical protein
MAIMQCGGFGFVCTDTSECFAFVMTGTEESVFPVGFLNYISYPALHNFEIDLHHAYPNVQLTIFNTFGIQVYDQMLLWSAEDGGCASEFCCGTVPGFWL